MADAEPVGDWDARDQAAFDALKPAVTEALATHGAAAVLNALMSFYLSVFLNHASAFHVQSTVIGFASRVPALAAEVAKQARASSLGSA